MIRLVEQRSHFLPVRTRMPFRYGIATMTDLPMAFIFLKFQFGPDPSETHWGVASDLLPPRWFKKDPTQALEAEVEEMKSTVRRAIEAARGLQAPTPFAFWDLLSQKQLAVAQESKIPELLVNFGTSFVERALLDAFARFHQQPLSQLIQTGKLGLELDRLHPELRGESAATLLPKQPLTRIQARHTIGFGDPLTEKDISVEARVADALPQSLEAAIGRYGLSQFKVKINGQIEEDLARLTRLARLLARLCPSGFSLSLDGNEQFSSWNHFGAFWSEAKTQPKLQALLDNVLFIEQPISRESALHSEGIGQLPDGGATPPVIIDESDAGPQCFRQALDRGYRGVSHKNCKGIFKGISNRCLIEQRSRHANQDLFMSGEDLCNIGPVALLQDLTLQSLLGNASVERNGHHYFYGLSPFPAAIQILLCDRHPELYKLDPNGTACLQITDGAIPTASLRETAFGTRFTPEELCLALGLETLSC